MTASAGWRSAVLYSARPRRRRRPLIHPPAYQTYPPLATCGC